MDFGKHLLQLDPAAETARVVAALQRSVRRLRRHGAVTGISGGVDSAVVMALCVRAFGPGRVCAVCMPERESSPESLALAQELGARFEVTPVVEDMTAALAGLGCYERRDAAIRRVLPEYDAALGYKARITLPDNLLEDGTFNVYSVTIVRPDGTEETRPLAPPEFLGIVAASNFKQRARMSMLYYHAELRHYAVIGTANKNEHDQGFFVKYGDGGSDVAPIEHLYKTQVYQLAEYLGVPEAIRTRTPTTDTYSAPTSQQEFFFRLPFETMDLLWYAQENGVAIEDVARATGFTPSQIQRAFDDFDRKARATAYLRTAPLRLDGEAAAAEPIRVSAAG